MNIGIKSFILSVLLVLCTWVLFYGSYQLGYYLESSNPGHITTYFLAVLLSFSLFSSFWLLIYARLSRRR